jgi:diguanylate cyclase (GGDEF)-like protein
MHGQLRRRVGLGLGVAALLMIAVAVAVNLAATESAERNLRVQHTHEVLELIESIFAAAKDAESSQRGFLLTGNAELEVDFLATMPEAAQLSRQLIARLSDNPAQLERARNLLALIEQRMRHAAEVVQLYRSDGSEAARSKVQTGVGLALMRQIEALRDELSGEERLLLQERNARADGAAAWMLLGVEAGQALSVLILLLVSWRMFAEMRQRAQAEQDTAAVNLQLTGLVGDLKLHGEQTRELAHFAGMLQSCRSVQEAVEVCRDSMLRISPDTAGSLYLLPEAEKVLELAIGWGGAPADRAGQLSPDDCWAMRRGQRYVVGDPRTATRCAHVQAGPQGSAYLCMPLVAQGRVLGMLHVCGDDVATADQADLVEAASEQLSLALNNLRLQESLRQQSIRDPLTGLFNRRYLEESIEREVARCGRRGLPLSVMMFDVDHFKRFNDTHGHDGGDALLAALGKLIRGHCRTEDIACRYGGEEFTIILPEMPLQRAEERAQALRHAVEAMQVMHLKQPLSRVTSSIGLAAMPQHGSEAADLMRIADTALYAAKHGGRNRVEVAGAAASTAAPS